MKSYQLSDDRTVTVKIEAARVVDGYYQTERVGGEIHGVYTEQVQCCKTLLLCIFNYLLCIVNLVKCPD